MAFIDGTRSATLSMSHTQNVAVRMWNPSAIVPPDQVWQYSATNFTFSGHLGFSASLAIGANVVQPGGPGTPWTWQLRANIIVNNGHGSTASNYVVISSATESGSTSFVDVTDTVAGAFTASVSVDKLWDIAESGYSSTIAPSQFPSTTSYTWYEKTTAGATASCSLTAGSGGVSISSAAISRVNANYTATLGSTSSSVGPAAHDFALSLVKVNGIAVHDITHTHTWYDQNATEWTMHCEGGIDAFGIYTGASGTISTSSCLDRNVTIPGRIRSWNGAYPDSLNVTINGFDGGNRTVGSTGGTYGATDTFVNYSTSTVLVDPDNGSNTKSTSANDVPSWISANLSGTGLSGNGDNANDNRVMFRGWRFNGWSLTETNSVSISGSTNDRTYSPMQGLSGFRYLDVQVKAQTGTGVPGVIELTDYHNNTKRWNVIGATTTYATVTLDLCSPDVHSLGALPATDSKDNPYPRVNTFNAAYAGTESVDSAYWGITACKRLRVFSGAIDIGTTTLRYTNSNSTYVPDTPTAAFERVTPAIVAEADTTTYYYGRRYWQQDRDGRNEEESDVWWQKTVGGATGVTSWGVSFLTIANLADQINASDNSVVRHPGWNATRSVPVPGGVTCTVTQPPLRDCFLNGDTGYAMWIYGSGILATPNVTSGTDFAYGHQITTGAVTAQTIFDRINGNFPPDLHDPFDVNGGTDSGLYLPAGSLLRGIGHGALLTQAGDPLTTATVDLLLASTLANRGTDSTIDGQGRYYTDAPWGLGESNHDISYSTSNIGLLPLHTSHRHRGWFREQELAGVCVSADVGPNQRLCYAVIESGTVALHFADGPNGTNWTMQTTSIVASCVHIAYDPSSLTGRLHIVTEESGNTLRSYYTDNEGGTISVPVTVTTGGDDVSVAIAPTGKRIVVYHHNNDLYRVVYDAVGNIITAASVIVSGGVQQGKTAVTWRLGIWYAYYRTGGGSLVQISSVNDGESWI